MNLHIDIVAVKKYPYKKPCYIDFYVLTFYLDIFFKDFPNSHLAPKFVFVILPRSFFKINIQNRGDIIISMIQNNVMCRNYEFEFFPLRLCSLKVRKKPTCWRVTEFNLDTTHFMH